MRGGGRRFMTISHMTRRPPWSHGCRMHGDIITTGGSDIPSGFIPGANAWITSDAMLMKTCGLTLKMAEIRYSNLVPRLFI